MEQAMGECAALASPGCESVFRSGLKGVNSYPKRHNLILHPSRSVGSFSLPTRHDYPKSQTSIQSWTNVKLRREKTPLSFSCSVKPSISLFSSIPSDDPGTDPSAGCNAEKCQHGLDSLYHQTLGVDLGDRSTGVAVSWGDLGAPRQLQVLQLAPAPLLRTLLELAEAEGADEIVVGLPLSAAGTESEQAKKCRKFAERLAAAAHSREIRVYLYDESLTSKDAMAYMIKSGVKRKARKAGLDSMAAAVLLESYFRDGGRRAERVYADRGPEDPSRSDLEEL